MRPIDADSLSNLIKIRMAWHSGYSVEEVLTDIAQSPTINEWGEPDKPTGEWIAVEKPRFGNPYRHYKCSRCGNPVPYRVRYCDSCGSHNSK